jgi:hypothetical protein
MQWKFWKWKKNGPGREDAETAAEIPRPPLPVSSREILGLQQLIGNQAVLRIMSSPLPKNQRRFKQGR